MSRFSSHRGLGRLGLQAWEETRSHKNLRKASGHGHWLGACPRHLLRKKHPTASSIDCDPYQGHGHIRHFRCVDHCSRPRKLEMIFLGWKIRRLEGERSRWPAAPFQGCSVTVHHNRRGRGGLSREVCLGRNTVTAEPSVASGIFYAVSSPDQM